MGVRPSPLDTSATIWPVVLAIDNSWFWVWTSGYNEWQGKPKYSEKTCFSPAFSTTKQTWCDLNLGCRGWKPVTDCLSYGVASITITYWLFLSIISIITHSDCQICHIWPHASNLHYRTLSTTSLTIYLTLRSNILTIQQLSRSYWLWHTKLMM